MVLLLLGNFYNREHLSSKEHLIGNIYLLKELLVGNINKGTSKEKTYQDGKNTFPQADNVAWSVVVLSQLQALAAVASHSFKHLLLKHRKGA